MLPAAALTQSFSGIAASVQPSVIIIPNNYPFLFSHTVILNRHRTWHVSRLSPFSSVFRWLPIPTHPSLGWFGIFRLWCTHAVSPAHRQAPWSCCLPTCGRSVGIQRTEVHIIRTPSRMMMMMLLMMMMIMIMMMMMMMMIISIEVLRSSNDGADSDFRWSNKDLQSVTNIQGGRWGASHKDCAQHGPNWTLARTSDNHSHMLDAAGIDCASALRVEFTTLGSLWLFQYAGVQEQVSPTSKFLWVNPITKPSWVAPPFALA